MRINFGFILFKVLVRIFPYALRDCSIDKKAKVGSGCNCIRTSLGKYSYMGNNCVSVNASIGAFCSIASYCCIGGGSHPTSLPSTSPVFYKGRNVFRRNFLGIEFDAEKAVSIGNDVWIGEKVFIMDGISVGNGAIIGSHSVVTHDIPPYAIVAGCPARVIRFRFDEQTIEKLQQLRWWEWDDKKIEDNSYAFSDIEKLLSVG